MSHFTAEDALSQLSENREADFLVVFQHGSLRAEIYRPDRVDRQTPHARDEIYVIIKGEGTFVNDGKVVRFSAGDFIFVKAGNEHRFLEFGDDFCTWVFFYGPEGGEVG